MADVLEATPIATRKPADTPKRAVRERGGREGPAPWGAPPDSALGALPTEVPAKERGARPSRRARPRDPPRPRRQASRTRVTRRAAAVNRDYVRAMRFAFAGPAVPRGGRLLRRAPGGRPCAADRTPAR